VGPDAPSRHAARPRELSLLLVGAAPRALDWPRRACRRCAALRDIRCSRGRSMVSMITGNAFSKTTFRKSIAAARSRVIDPLFNHKK
jgi:hypothetical protein